MSSITTGGIRGWMQAGAFAVLAAAMVAGGCEKKEAGGTETKPSGGTPTASAGAIKIGHYGSLTGSEATFGQSTDNGIKLAVQQVNAKGGVSVGGQKRLIELVSDDTEGKPEKAGTVVTKLITKDQVVAVIGEVASSVTLAGAPVAQAYGVPMITPSSTNTEVTKKGDYIFRVCYIDPFQGQAAAKFAMNDLKLSKAAVLFDQQSAYSSGLKDEFSKAFTAAGGKVVSEQAYTKGAADFNAQLARIREAGADHIFIPGYYTDVANIARQARALGINVPLLGGDGWDSDELGKNAGAAIENSFYTNHYAPDDPAPVIQDFVKAYQGAFGGATPDGLAALGYDAAKVLFEAIERAGSTDGAKLRAEIAKTTDFKGVTGDITLNADRDAVKPIVVVERKGGKWIFRAQIKP